MKGQIESVFTWLTRKVAHRIAGTTKSNPAQLGDLYDSVAAGEKAGITYEVFQDLLYQSIVDGYMREWDGRRGGRRYQLWRDAVEQYGIQQFSGSPDDLILLLMKRVNRKDGSARLHVVHANNAISYKNRPYVCPGVFEALVGKEVTLYVNEEDERVVYPFAGVLFCVVVRDDTPRNRSKNPQRTLAAPYRSAEPAPRVETSDPCCSGALEGHQQSVGETVPVEPRLNAQPRRPRIGARELGDAVGEPLERLLPAAGVGDHRVVPPWERGCDVPRPAERRAEQQGRAQRARPEPCGEFRPTICQGAA